MARDLVTLAKELHKRTKDLAFGKTVSHVYAPLGYAWPVAREYLERFGEGPKEVVLLGMNPGPFGMAQTGVPFGEVAIVRDWMKLDGKVGKPEREHPKRPVLGLASTRSEVSGKRLWGGFRARHPDPATFFARGFVLNYCPLLFLSESGANLTPDKLPAKEREALDAACLDHLRGAIEILAPKVAVGVGVYAAKKIESLAIANLRTATMPHPSPASPTANKGWDRIARTALENAGVHGLL